MATTYQTIPTEPTTAPEKSWKGVVFRTAAAAFALGVVAATAVESDAMGMKWWGSPFDGTPCFNASCGVLVKGVDC